MIIVILIVRRSYVIIKDNDNDNDLENNVQNKDNKKYWKIRKNLESMSMITLNNNNYNSNK